LARRLNLGILAHVDAGKTTLTERLLYAAGVISEPGSVDEGTTQTDYLALERQRGITIKSAVVSFEVRGSTVNLIDTPGHPDFIAEVERVLGVLDGAVMVISAVEGVQPQTRVLMRALQRLNIPALIFVNKIDRVGAGNDRLLRAITDKLRLATVTMGETENLGSRQADFRPYTAADPGFAASLAEELADHDDEFLSAYITGGGVSFGQISRSLKVQARRARVYPVFFGSAMTGAGVETLLDAITELLPTTGGGGGEPASGTVFKVERGPAGEKIAYVRVFSGLVRVGATLGDVPRTTRHRQRQFAPPALEAVIVPSHPRDRGRLRVALARLAEQDPFINVRQDDLRQEIYLSLYGEVQKEVVQDTLSSDFGIQVEFRDTKPICIERLVGAGKAVEFNGQAPNPFLATVGLNLEPAAIGTGVQFCLAVEPGAMPLAFFRAVEDTVRQTLQQGLFGWQVTDCAVTMTHSGYSPRQSHAHQGFSKGMSSTGADFRGLTPLVVMNALRQAGTTVCEPVHRFHLEVPGDLLGPLMPVLSRLGAVPGRPAQQGPTSLLEGDIPAANVHKLQLELPELTGGEGYFESDFDHFRAVAGTVPGAVPVRPRTDNNPLDRKEYLLHVLRRV
jgi:ribosomal protection tetracycline resistance protein